MHYFIRVNTSLELFSKQLLKQAANEIRNITNGIVEGKIITKIHPTYYMHTFSLLVPLLCYSAVPLFDIKQPLISEFPIYITSNSSIFGSPTIELCNNINEFECSLKKLTFSHEVTRVVNSLISHTKE